MRVTLDVEGVNLEKLLSRAQAEGIVLLGARRTGARRMRVSIAPDKRPTLEALCEKSGWGLREVRVDGGLRAARVIARRPMLPVSLALCVLLVWLSSQMILSVRIEHAQEHVAEVRRFLAQEGVHPGRFKRAFSTDDLRVKLALHVPGLAFASLRYAGSTLVVDCRPSVLGEQWKTPGSELDVVAAQPGIITHIFASSGTPQVVPGQAVHRGQVLIRGEERTQQGGVRPVQAEGEVHARVFAKGEAKVKLTKKRSVETGRMRTQVTLRTPWYKRILRRAEPFESSEQSSDDQFIVGLYLPLWREKTTYAETEVFVEKRNRGDAASVAQGAAEKLAKKDCPYDALILDKFVDYSMIDDEFLYAVVVLEYEASIEGRMK